MTRNNAEEADRGAEIVRTTAPVTMVVDVVGILPSKENQEIICTSPI
jgi:hypothetical protein